MLSKNTARTASPSAKASGDRKASPYKKPVKVAAKMANEKDITKILKTKVGLLHPFGPIFGLPLFFDNKLAKNKKLVIPAGSYVESLEISTKDFIKISGGTAGNFTE